MARTQPKKKIHTEHDDPHALWQFRLEREGNWRKVKREIIAVKKETGEKGYSTIVHRIAGDHDYRGATEERELFRQYLQVESDLQKGDIAAQSEFESIVNRFPLKTVPKTENNWIASHPAMRRRARNPKANKVILSIDDVLEAPSQAAVNKLQYWCNEPKEFFKGLQAAEKPPPQPVVHKKEEAEVIRKKDPTLVEVRSIITNILDDLPDAHN
tara:strand:- start:728 stop:1366 length:639 start_codon:yes stop_codon:yes gene_type:complete